MLGIQRNFLQYCRNPESTCMSWVLEANSGIMTLTRKAHDINTYIIVRALSNFSPTRGLTLHIEKLLN